MTTTIVRLLLSGALGASLTACGSKTPPAPPAAAPTEPSATPPVVADEAPRAPEVPATPPAPTVDAPAPAPTVWLAWRYDAEGALETALVGADAADADQPPARKGDAITAVGPNVYKLGSDVTKLPVRPCDEAAEATFVALGVTGIEPATPIKRVELADVAKRPQRDEARIHEEKLTILGQAGPLVWVHHEMNSDICPIPGTGAEYDAYRVVDVRDGRSVALIDIYNADALTALKTDAFEAAWTAIKADHPDAPEDAKAALTLHSIDCAWSDAGVLGCKADIYTAHKHFADPDDGDVVEGVATATVPVPVPGRLAEYAADTAPEAVVAFWKGGSDGGRGFSVVSADAAKGVRAWFAASDAAKDAVPAP